MFANKSPGSALNTRLFCNLSQSSGRRISTVKSSSHNLGSSAMSFPIRRTHGEGAASDKPQILSPPCAFSLVPYHSLSLPLSLHIIHMRFCSEHRESTACHYCRIYLIFIFFLNKDDSKRLWWNFHAMEKLCNLFVTNMGQLSVKPFTKYTIKRGVWEKILNSVVFQYGPHYVTACFYSKSWVLLTHEACSYYSMVFLALSPFSLVITVFAKEKAMY